MAGGIDWFRWHHGSVTDQKFPLIARKAGASVAEVIAVWACLLESASMNGELRGQIGGQPDFEAMDCALGIEEGRSMAICTAMVERGIVDDSGHISAWAKRQPKREREDDNSTARVKAFREKQRHETPGNATEGTETPRGEESREEEIQSKLKLAGTRPAAEVPAEVAEIGLGKQKQPDCPHLEVLALWAEVLPALPQHDPLHWRGARADHLRARWRETAAAKQWQTQAEGLAYLRKFFGYVGQSRFLTGKSPPYGKDRRPFVIELEWLVSPTNWAKVHEGKYHMEEVAA